MSTESISDTETALETATTDNYRHIVCARCNNFHGRLFDEVPCPLNGKWFESLCGQLVQYGAHHSKPECQKCVNLDQKFECPRGHPDFELSYE